MTLPTHALSLLLVLSACTGATPPDTPSPDAGLVGGIHPPLPGGYEERSSLLLDDSPKPRHALFEWHRNGAPVISLARTVNDSVPHWRTVNVLHLPVIGSADVLVLGVCRTATGAERGLIAIARGGTGDSLRQVRFAWRADTARGEFRRISPRGIVCDNEAMVIPQTPP